MCVCVPLPKINLWLYLWIQGTLVDSRLFLEANIFCLLCSAS